MTEAEAVIERKILDMKEAILIKKLSKIDEFFFDEDSEHYTFTEEEPIPEY